VRSDPDFIPALYDVTSRDRPWAQVVDVLVVTEELLRVGLCTMIFMALMPIVLMMSVVAFFVNCSFDADLSLFKLDEPLNSRRSD
jgi:hypothetical protein